MQRTMITVAIAVASISVPLAHAEEAKDGFSFNSASISGFPTGAASLTGGGAYKLSTLFIKTGGSFKCTADISQGPLTGCKAGEGVRWDPVALLPATPFKCTGADGETLKTAVTDGNTVVMIADFYRQGDGNDESFTARMFVSEVDEAPDLSGDQKVWIQGVGVRRRHCQFQLISQ